MNQRPELVKFNDVKMNGKFVYKNCLFIKTSDGGAHVVGAAKGQNFQADEEVGMVVGAAYAPGHEPKEQPATPENEEATETTEPEGNE